MNAPARPGEISGLEQQARISGWGAMTVVASIWGFFDESGEQGQGGRLKRLTLGGFFVPWPEIETLCQRWREAPDAENLSEFHMKNIASDEHAFLDWPPERQRRLDRFVDILCDHAKLFGAYIYVPTRKNGAFVQAYRTGLARVLIELENHCIDSSARGNIVFARTPEISKALIGRFFDQANWSDKFDGYAVRKSANKPALQAAEIVARGMKQLMQDGLITHSFQRILMTGKPIRFY